MVSLTMKTRNILFIVEGETDEPDFLNKMFQVCFEKYQFQCWAYRTSLHDLVCDLYPDGNFDPDIETYMAFDQVSLFDIECEKHLTQNDVDVVNTAITLILEYEPVRTLEEYHRHSARYEL